MKRATALIRRALFVGVGSIAAWLPGQSAHAAFGYCSQPIAPSVRISKPTKPYCAVLGKCSDWEIEAYRDDLERYFEKLKKYIADVDTYSDEAYAYAKCMADLD